MGRFESLMVTLRNLSRRPDAGSSDCIKGAKLAVWKCILEELGEVDREPFLRKLRKQANDEEKNAPDEQVKLFWRGRGPVRTRSQETPDLAPRPAPREHSPPRAVVSVAQGRDTRDGNENGENAPRPVFVERRAAANSDGGFLSHAGGSCGDS